MSVLALFAVETGDHDLVRLFRGYPADTVEIDRVSSVERGIGIYLWVTTQGQHSSNEIGEGRSTSLDCHRLDRQGEATLLRISRNREAGDVFNGLIDAGASVLRGDVGSDTMRFLVEFADHDRLAKFYNYCIEYEVPIRLKRVHSITDQPEHAREYGLTMEQREALALAAKYGYFSTPREVTLSELAEEFGISQQALSQRIRRATEKVVLESMGFSPDHR